MSVIVQISDQVGNHYRVLSKGAPEILKKFMKEVPSDYDSLYLKHVKEGSRVLALAYKPIQKMSQLEFNAFTREQAECDLIFSGFIVAECPLKPDTKSVIQELKDSSHQVKMITGDNALTAAYIGQELKFGNGSSLFAASSPSEGVLVWNDIDDKFVVKTDGPTELEKFAEKNLLCISGDVLDKVILIKDHA